MPTRPGTNPSRPPKKLLYIDLPKVATTNLPNLPGEMHPDPAFVPRLRKGQRADYPTRKKVNSVMDQQVSRKVEA